MPEAMKKLKTAQKKLKQILDIKTKIARGDNVELNQLDKIKGEAALVIEQQRWETELQKLQK